MDPARLLTYVSQSQLLPGGAAGRGLFARRPLAAGIVIGEYRGELLTAAEFRRRYEYQKSTRQGVYVLRCVDPDTGQCTYVDCSNPRRSSLMRYANDAGYSPATNTYQPEKNNADFCGTAVVARRDIGVGEEICVTYGAQYWW